LCDYTLARAQHLLTDEAVSQSLETLRQGSV
jgi:hypothetical protein